MLRVLAFAASVRKGSMNRKLIKIAADIAREKDAAVDLAEYDEFDTPLYNGNVEDSSGVPEGAHEFQRRLEAADGLMIASPEYNNSIPGTLKNTIDWVSRLKPSPFQGRVGFLLSASPSPFGGIRGLQATRTPLQGLGMIVHPEMFCLMKAPEAYNDDGAFADPINTQVLNELIGKFLNLTRSLKEV